MKLYFSAQDGDKNDYESLVVVIAAAPAFFNPMLVGHWIKEKYHQVAVNTSFNRNFGENILPT